jgi:hypothetical protein
MLANVQGAQQQHRPDMVRIDQESFQSPQLARAGRPAHMSCLLEVLCTKIKCIDNCVLVFDP